MANIILLHGAYQGGWIWKPVVAALTAKGHAVLAPTLDGCGERRHTLRPGITTETQADEVADLLFLNDMQDVVVVGTSLGGMVACALAERAPERIGRLVFADALALKDGESLRDFVPRKTESETDDISTVPTRADAEGRMFADLEPGLRAWAIARYAPAPIATMEAKVSLPTFWSRKWPATVIYCRRSINPPEAHQRRTADLLGAKWLELETGHYPMLSEPVKLAEMILA